MPELDLKAVSEEMRSMYEDMMDNPGTTSFSDLEQVATPDPIENLDMLFTIAHMMLWNIGSGYYPVDAGAPTDRVAMARNLMKEFQDMADMCLSEDMSKEKTSVLDDLRTKFANLFSKEAKHKVDGGVSYSASDYLYVPDASKPSTWKLRIAEGKSGNVTEAQLGRAAAALSSGGYMGNQVKMSKPDMTACKRKLRSKYKEMGLEMPESLKSKASGLSIWKDQSTGQYRWLANYSNNFRDEDIPSDIISEQSHLRFEQMVDNKEAEFPELWHWHLPGTQWGQADWIAYDKDNGVAMAAGYVLEGHEAEAEAMMELNEEIEIGVSHGMPKDSILRDSANPSVIVGHVTKEISDLPLWAAANKLTSFYIFEEKDMAIPDKKKEYLVNLMGVERVKEIEEENERKSKSAKEQGIESKEASAVTETAKDEAPSTTADAVDTKQVEEAPVSETKEEPQAQIQESVVTVEFVTKEAFDKMTASIEAMTGMLEQKFAEISARLTEVENKDTGIPTASLAALMAQRMTATEAKENVVKANAKLAKSGPAENEESSRVEYSSDPIANLIMNSVIGKR